MTAWSEGPFVGYDLESTGVDPREARIVTAAVVYAEIGAQPRTISWLLDPGVDVPTDAAEVHGWTREEILARVGKPGHAIRRTTGGLGGDREMTMAVDGALGEIAGHLASAMARENPVVIANAAYDTTLTETELTRHGIDTLTSRPTGIRGVVDPMVINRQWDPYRKVKRDGGCRGGKYHCGGCGAPDSKLGSLCQHYGITLDRAHSAGADAFAAVRLAVRLGDLWGEINRWKLGALHEHQITWRAAQMASLEEYHRKHGQLDGDYDRGWPLHSSLQPVAVG
jgi:DNA polymerase-3 subunit epsilon